MKPAKLLVFGIDGADFHHLGEFIDDLPHLKKLKSRSAYCILKSTIPPHTSMAWPTFYSGVEPGKHGLLQFWDVQAKDYGSHFMTSNDIGSPPVWEWLSHEGYRVNVVNVPMTHPPKPVEGHLISWPLTNTLRFSYPDTLIRDIVQAVGPYLSDLATMYRGESDYMDKASKYINMRTKTLTHLMGKQASDFNMVVYTEIDRISHYAFGQAGNSLQKAYQLIDQALGALMEHMDPLDVICIVSDHGFTASKEDFHIHEFLQSKQMLKYKSHHIGNQSDWYLDQIDWHETICYMPSPGSYALNINLQGRQQHGIIRPEQYDSVVDQLKQQLLDIRTSSHEPLFSKVVRGNELYQGKCSHRAPDLVLIPHDFSYMVVPHRSSDGKWFSPSEQNGYHGMDGIFYLSAPGISRGLKEPIRMIDALPNLLYAAGHPIPDHLEGNVINSFFDESWLRQHPVCRIPLAYDFECENNSKTKEFQDFYSVAERNEIEEKLRALGYMD